MNSGMVLNGLRAKDPRFRIIGGTSIVSSMYSKVNDGNVKKIQELLDEMNVTCASMNDVASWPPKKLEDLVTSLTSVKDVFIRSRDLWNEIGFENEFPFYCPASRNVSDLLEWVEDLIDVYNTIEESLTKLKDGALMIKQLNQNMGTIQLPWLISDGFYDVNAAIISKITDNKDTYEEWGSLIQSTPGAHLINYHKNSFTLKQNISDKKSITIEIPDLTNDLKDLKSANEIINGLSDKVKEILKSYPEVDGNADANWLYRNAINARDNEEKWMEEAEAAKKASEENDAIANHIVKIIIVIVSVILAVTLILVIYAGVSHSKKNQQNIGALMYYDPKTGQTYLDQSQSQIQPQSYADQS